VLRAAEAASKATMCHEISRFHWIIVRRQRRSGEAEVKFRLAIDRVAGAAAAEN
jgi:hypothetical protein